MAESNEISPELEEKLSELEIMRQALEESKQKASNYYDQLLRLKAEFDNFRKRVEREKQEARAWGKEEVLVQLVLLVDVFEQAILQAHIATDLKDVVEGIDMLYKNFSQFLKSEGLEPIHLVGHAFDPNLAEAVEQEEVDEKNVGKVLGEIQKGYRFHGKVLRPSRVRVGVAKKSS